MQVGCLAIVCATLTACDTKESAQFKAALTLQRRIAQIAGQSNGAAPAVIDPNTRLDGARAGPGLRLTVMYTLVNAESNGVDGATFDDVMPVLRAMTENVLLEVQKTFDFFKATASTERIDRVLLHRAIGFAVFAVVMAVSTGMALVLPGLRNAEAAGQSAG